jgi:hypothetical protein
MYICVCVCIYVCILLNYVASLVKKNIGTSLSAACQENFSRVPVGTRAIGSSAVQ